ncbi:MAG: hypothetical protein WCB85_06755 [Candidatus Dormiibacterota bacterium]
MKPSSRDRDRALDLRTRIRDYCIALAVAGTAVFALVAAATLPGRSTAGTAASQGSSQAAAQSAGTAGSGLQAPSQLPTQGQGGGVVTGGS